MSGDPGGCACHGCGSVYRVDVLVPDNVWDRIRPSGSVGAGGLLCGLCIMRRLEAAGDFAAFRLVGA